MKKYIALLLAFFLFSPQLGEAQYSCSDIDITSYIQTLQSRGSEEMIQQYLDSQDREFSSLFQNSLRTGSRCTLQTIGTSFFDIPSAPDWEGFVEERIIELRKIDCAILYVTEKSDHLLKKDCTSLDRSEQLNCNINIRKEVLLEQKDILKYTLESALQRAQHIMIILPLHAQMQCAAAELTKQREVFLNFFQVFALFPKAFSNAASQ